MDISNISPNDREYEIVHPNTEEPIGWTFRLRSESSKELRAYDEAWRAKNAKRRTGKLTGPMIEDYNLGKTVAAIAGWSFADGVNYKGATPECTPAEVRRVLKEQHWIRLQVEAELRDEGAFFES